MKWCHFWIQKLLKNINICIQKLAKWTIFLLDPEIDEMLQFLDPEIVEKHQFLDPEIVEMDITYFWIQKLMKWCNFWIQKLLKWSPNPLRVLHRDPGFSVLSRVLILFWSVLKKPLEIREYQLGFLSHAVRVRERRRPEHTDLVKNTLTQ